MGLSTGSNNSRFSPTQYTLALSPGCPKLTQSRHQSLNLAFCVRSRSRWGSLKGQCLLIHTCKLQWQVICFPTPGIQWWVRDRMLAIDTPFQKDEEKRRHVVTTDLKSTQTDVRVLYTEGQECTLVGSLLLPNWVVSFSVHCGPCILCRGPWLCPQSHPGFSDKQSAFIAEYTSQLAFCLSTIFSYWTVFFPFDLS